MLRIKTTVAKSGYVRNILIAVLIILAVIAVGVVGYVFIENMSFTEAFYMTMITISTVGFREVKPLSAAGEWFTIFIIVIGVSAVLFFLAGFFEFILSEVLGDVWGRRRMNNIISRLSNHFIICGYGRVGRSVSEELTEQGKTFVVIESDEETFHECLEDGYLAVPGSATDNEVLIEAGIEKAVGLVSALRSDADNLFVVLTSRTMNPNILLIARADQPESEQKLEMVGADRVISPHKIAGKRMANLLVRPGACEFLDVALMSSLPEYYLSELKVGDESDLLGKTIKESRLREQTGVTVLAVRKSDERVFNPNPSVGTRIEQGDILILIGTPEQMELMESEHT